MGLPVSSDWRLQECRYHPERLHQTHGPQDRSTEGGMAYVPSQLQVLAV